MEVFSSIINNPRCSDHSWDCIWGWGLWKMLGLDFRNALWCISFCVTKLHLKWAWRKLCGCAAKLAPLTTKELILIKLRLKDVIRHKNCKIVMPQSHTTTCNYPWKCILCLIFIWGKRGQIFQWSVVIYLCGNARISIISHLFTSYFDPHVKFHISSASRRIENSASFGFSFFSTLFQAS